MFRRCQKQFSRLVAEARAQLNRGRFERLPILLCVPRGPASPVDQLHVLESLQTYLNIGMSQMW